MPPTTLGTLPSITANLQASMQSYQSSVEALASMELNDPSDVAVLAAVSSEMSNAEYQVEAAAEISKSQDDVMGRLIDIYA
ncbi:MAG: hypothetical protein VX185_00615 [Pseudomonadota bacterium]|nr:hypothetical protein [Pseudomonadota bacterium]